MVTYIALFRGINIGGHYLVPMKELVALLADMGHRNIRTYIQSGNVVFQSGKGKRHEIAQAISRKILTAYSFEPKVILLGETELQEAIDNNPFSTAVGNTVHLFFLDSTPENPNLERLQELKARSEQFRLNKNIFYLFAPEGVSRSKLPANVEKCLGIPATARNWNTVRKLLEIVRDEHQSRGRKDE